MNIFVYESVKAVEVKLIAKSSVDFNDFLRGLPFYESTDVNVISVEFESGVEQTADLWGRHKRKFDVNFPPMTIAESMKLRTFYESKIGLTFPFKNPLDGVTYTVRFMDNSFQLERRHFNIVYARVIIVEVF